jgi:hypothetical protein
MPSWPREIKSHPGPLRQQRGNPLLPNWCCGVAIERTVKQDSHKAVRYCCGPNFAAPCLIGCRPFSPLRASIKDPFPLLLHTSSSSFWRRVSHLRLPKSPFAALAHNCPALWALSLVVLSPPPIRSTSGLDSASIHTDCAGTQAVVHPPFDPTILVSKPWIRQ